MRDHPIKPAAQMPDDPLRVRTKSMLWLVAVVAIVALALDLLSKAWALANLEEGVAQPFLGTFIQLQLIHNPHST